MTSSVDKGDEGRTLETQPPSVDANAPTKEFPPERPMDERFCSGPCMAQRDSEAWSVCDIACNLNDQDRGYLTPWATRLKRAEAITELRSGPINGGAK
jgi:hypothetical protein